MYASLKGHFVALSVNEAETYGTTLFNIFLTVNRTGN